MFNILKLFVRMLTNECGMATIPGTASTINAGGMDVAALRRTAWRSKNKEDSVRPSVFTTVKTIFKIVGGEAIILKKGTLLDVSSFAKRAVGGGQHVVCAIRTPLREAPQEGNSAAADMLGNEDETDLLYTKIYYNEIKKAVKYNTWGYDFNDTEYMNYNAGYSEFVGLYWSELDDHRFQTALLLGASNELTAAPVNFAQTFNPNWAVPNIDPSAYPPWDPTAVVATSGAIDAEGWYPNRSFAAAGSFVENIAAALIAAGGVGPTSNAVLDVDAIYEIASWIQDRHICEPIDGPTYIWKMPIGVINWMLNPNNTNSLGAYWQNVAAYTDTKPMLPGEVGMLAGLFRVVRDPRCPTLTVSGDVGTYSLTPGWIRPGNNDDRNNGAWSNTSGDTNYVWDMTTIMGAEALAVLNRNELVSDLIESTEFGKRKGKGSYKGSGIMIPKWDKGTETTTSLIYRGSVEVPVSRRSVRS